MELKFALKRLFRHFGIEVSRTSPDASLALFVTSLIAHLGINCVLDVGAHYGEFARSLRDHGYRGRIVSFEPVREHIVRLADRARHDARWTIAPYALGSVDGQLAINIATGGDLTSFRIPRSDSFDRFAEDIRTQRTDIVQVRRLDSVMQDVTVGLPEPRLFLKLDTQGWDLEVVHGAEQSLELVLAIQTEMAVQPLYENMPLYRSSVDELGEYGFLLSAVYPLNRDDAGALIEFDGVLVRPQSRHLSTTTA